MCLRPKLTGESPFSYHSCKLSVSVPAKSILILHRSLPTSHACQRWCRPTPAASKFDCDSTQSKHRNGSCTSSFRSQRPPEKTQETPDRPLCVPGLKPHHQVHRFYASSEDKAPALLLISCTGQFQDTILKLTHEQHCANHPYQVVLKQRSRRQLGPYASTLQMYGVPAGLDCLTCCTSSVYPQICSRQESPWSGKLLERCAQVLIPAWTFQATLVLTCWCSRAWLAAWTGNSISCIQVFSRAYGPRWETHRAQGDGVAV